MYVKLLKIMREHNATARLNNFTYCGCDYCKLVRSIYFENQYNKIKDVYKNIVKGENIGNEIDELIAYERVFIKNLETVLNEIMTTKIKIEGR